MQKPECNVADICMTRFMQYRNCFYYIKKLDSCKQCKLNKLYNTKKGRK